MRGKVGAWVGQRVPQRRSWDPSHGNDLDLTRYPVVVLKTDRQGTKLSGGDQQPEKGTLCA